MICFHIPLRSQWQMPLHSSPMAGVQSPPASPSLPAASAAASSKADLPSCLFTCLCVGKRKCFHWWPLRKHLEGEDQPGDSALSLPSPPPACCQKPTDFQTWLPEKECSLIGIPESSKPGSSSSVLLLSMRNSPGISLTDEELAWILFLNFEGNPATTAVQKISMHWSFNS
jgi:hypothetical protein